jgi:short-subunit dehydrogenase
MRDGHRFKSVVITGASSGIGAELAKYLARDGVVLCLFGRDKVRLLAVADICRQKGARVHTRQIDVTDRNGMADHLSELDDENPFDLIIANAGIGKSYEDPEFLRQTIDVNVIGVLNTIEPLMDRIKVRGHCQIGLMSSLSAFRAIGGPAGYAGSKAWVRLYGEALRARMAKYRVGVSIICPGFVDTPMVERAPKQFPAIDVAQAARQIIEGLDKDQGRIVFPTKFKLFIWLIAALPASLVDWFYIKK